MPSLAEVNAMDAAAFVSAFGDVAEHSPWVAEHAFRTAPYGNREEVIAAFERAMRAAPKERQLALIRAHPDLAGKAALAGDMAEDSKREQAGAGLDTLTEPEFRRFTDLNTRYLNTFGFPFIFAVKGATTHMILDAFETRIENGAAEEFETALEQIARIFRFRLEDRIDDNC